jgi:hypothetical protein
MRVALRSTVDGPETSLYQNSDSFPQSRRAARRVMLRSQLSVSCEGTVHCRSRPLTLYSHLRLRDLQCAMPVPLLRHIHITSARFEVAGKPSDCVLDSLCRYLVVECSVLTYPEENGHGASVFLPAKVHQLSTTTAAASFPLTNAAQHK